jgi:hypothetical protein
MDCLRHGSQFAFDLTRAERSVYLLDGCHIFSRSFLPALRLGLRTHHHLTPPSTWQEYSAMTYIDVSRDIL